MILIDTNIWAYYFDTTLSEHPQVIKPVEVALRKNQAAINATIVVETLHYLIKRLGPLVGGEKAHVFMNYGIPLYSLDEETLNLTRKKLCEYSHLGIGGRDASILATMEKETIYKIMTHDHAFKRVPKLEAIDPV
ncbi:MAG: type II toxin-antitoxin system VapC family toxin [Candidatus Thorarchaeota archaeon]|nr:type II toxin-antitoxin system VapC family toxin [Candidatus Thorarchaeota archaeon]